MTSAGSDAIKDGNEGGRPPAILRKPRKCPFPSCRLNTEIASEGFVICQDPPGPVLISGLSGRIGVDPCQLSQAVKGRRHAPLMRLSGTFRRRDKASKSDPQYFQSPVA